MSTSDYETAARAIQVNFVNCSSATTFAESVMLTSAEEADLATLLSNLEAAGVLLVPATSAYSARDLEGVLAYLRASVGDQIVEAALGTPPHVSSGGRPTAIMPVWQFTPEGDNPSDRDVLLSSGRLWGADVLIEALRVEAEERPAPVTEVRPRFERWLKAADGGRDRQVLFRQGKAALTCCLPQQRPLSRKVAALQYRHTLKSNRAWLRVATGATCQRTPMRRTAHGCFDPRQ